MEEGIRNAMFTIFLLTITSNRLSSQYYVQYNTSEA